MPGDDEVNNCAEAGVIGVLPGVIGSLMATEAIKYLAGVGELLTNSLLTYNALNNRFFTVGYMLSDAFAGPADEAAFHDTDYSFRCSRDMFREMVGQPDVIVVDVRELEEQPEAKGFAHVRIPMGEIEGKLSELSGKRVILFCKSGVRSAKAAAMLRGRGIEAFNVLLDL
jgi:adenylyltransferase/sulfurtransferase